MKVLKFCLIIVVSLFLACTSNVSEIYVSTSGSDENSGTRENPLMSAHRALEISKQMTEDVRIYFDNGIYFFDSTLVIENTNNSITFKTKEKEGSVIFSGGNELTDWRLENDLWVYDLPDNVYFEQLWIKDKRLTRARTPNENDELAQWNLSKAEFVWPDHSKSVEELSVFLGPEYVKDIEIKNDAEIVIFKDWAIYRKQIKNINRQTGEIELLPPFNKPKTKPGGHNTLTNAERVPGFTCYLEGAPEFIDQPGEWAIDTVQGKVYYKPFADQQIDSFKATYPLINQLVEIKGSKDKSVSHIKFEGITFSHTKYVLPKIGHDGKQAAMFYVDDIGFGTEYSTSIPEAIVLSYANFCMFDNCSFYQLGASGIRFFEGCDNNIVENSEFKDIGGNAVMIGLKADSPEDTLRLVSNNTIKNCDISYAGQHYPSAIGIWVGYAKNTIIESNHIHHLPYSGISNGWQWNNLPSTARDNKILNNHVHDVMLQLGDGGGIYVLGNQPGSEITGNKVHDIHRSIYNNASPNNGLYFDEGSKNYVASENEVYNISHAPVRGHRPSGVYLINNKLIAHDSISPVFVSPPYDNPVYVYSNDTVYWEKPDWLEGYDSIQLGFYMAGNSFE